MAEPFADLLGQPRAASLLAAALDRGHLAPAYLFAGPEGVGRRLAALRFLEGVLQGQAGASERPTSLRRRLRQGNHPDLLWVEPTHLHQGRLVPASRAEEEGVNRRSPPQIRLEQVREVSRFLARRPVESDVGLVVFDGVEAMAEAAANALLKTLEEPGAGLLILITAAPEQLVATIRSRCQLVPFRRLPADLVEQVLLRVDPHGAVDAPSEGAASPELLELAAGSPGALLQHRRRWRELPHGVAERLLHLGPDPLESLTLARDLTEALDAEQQLWLLGWWQLARWRRRPRVADMRRLERLRRQLLAHVQPRLAWEVALLELGGSGSASGAAAHAAAAAG
ncbi:MAG: DNA polymerase III subunit delta' [Synechococcaceae cyanobacterium]|nr:DNA polymerase III subunit delta' [Synechococcaceae cyanobacterium]